MTGPCTALLLIPGLFGRICKKGFGPKARANWPPPARFPATPRRTYTEAHPTPKKEKCCPPPTPTYSTEPALAAPDRLTAASTAANSSPRTAPTPSPARPTAELNAPTTKKTASSLLYPGEPIAVTLREEHPDSSMRGVAANERPFTLCGTPCCGCTARPVRTGPPKCALTQSRQLAD